MADYLAPSTGDLLVSIPPDCIIECAHPGPCDDDVAAWINRVQWHASDTMLREHLREYGAWDDLDSVDRDRLRMRTLWIACHDIREEMDQALASITGGE